MEDMLFATAEGLCREQGDMAEIVAGYLMQFYKREMNVKSATDKKIEKTQGGANSGGAGKMF